MPSHRAVVAPLDDDSVREHLSVEHGWDDWDIAHESTTRLLGWHDSQHASHGDEIEHVHVLTTETVQLLDVGVLGERIAREATRRVGQAMALGSPSLHNMIREAAIDVLDELRCSCLAYHEIGCPLYGVTWAERGRRAGSVSS